MQINREELAWAAGLFDGEGYVGAYRSNRSRPYPRVVINQVHPEVLERFQRAVLGVGKVYGPITKKKWKPQWSYDANGYNNVQAIAGLLWIFLSSVKRSQFLKILREMQTFLPYPTKREKKVCKHGHSLKDAYIKVGKDGYTRRSCRSCSINSKRTERELMYALRGMSS